MSLLSGATFTDESMDSGDKDYEHYKRGLLVNLNERIAMLEDSSYKSKVRGVAGITKVVGNVLEIKLPYASKSLLWNGKNKIMKVSIPKSNQTLNGRNQFSVDVLKEIEVNLEKDKYKKEVEKLMLEYRMQGVALQKGR